MSIDKYLVEKHGVKFIDFPSMTKEKWEDALNLALDEYMQGAPLVGLDTSPPTFNNTLGKLEELSSNLISVSSGLYTSYAHATSDIQELISKWSAIFAENFAKIYQDENLLHRIQSAYNNHGETWDGSQLKLYEDTIRNFKNSGAGLSPQNKERVSQLKVELSKLETQFEEINLANSNIKVKIPLEDLTSANQSILNSCKTIQIDGIQYKQIPVTSPFIEPLLASVDNRRVRKSLWDAWTSRGLGVLDTSTKDVIESILEKRTQMAYLLGYKTWSDYVLSSNMARTDEAVNYMLEDTLNKILPTVNKELETLQEFASEKGLDDKLEPWDIEFYLNKYKEEKFSIDQDKVKQYFPLDRVRSCAFESAQKVFGLKFEKDESIPSYHPDTVGYKVTKEINGRQENIGIIIIDDHIRDTKAPGAWMNSFASAHTFKEGNLAGVINVLNIPKGLDNKPVLLSFDEATTIYHELGHAIHGLLGKTPFISQSGTSVVRDFVELPSQVFENWFSSPQALKEVSSHFETGEKMPDDMLDNLLASQKFGQNFMKVTYLISAIVDMRLHQTQVDENTFNKNYGVFDWESDIIKGLNTPHALTSRHHASHFSHIFGGGYSSGYYSYLWAEVLDADVFSKFKEKGLYDEESCRSLCQLYELGGSLPAMDIFVRFMGREPNPDALLKRLGVELEEKKILSQKF